MQIWHGADPEWAICTGAPIRPPKNFCFRANAEEAIKFINQLVEGSHYTWREGEVLIRRVGSNRLRQINTYFDFSFPDRISTSVAVCLAAEYERMRTLLNQPLFTIDLDKWNQDVFRTLYQIGFFEIAGITPGRTDVVISEGETRTMQIVSSLNADDLSVIDQSLQSLGEFLYPDQDFPENILIDVLTSLSEAFTNVTNHAYPPDYEPDYPHIGRFWVSATANARNRTLTVVVYDQGATIPVTYPRISRTQAVVQFLSRALFSKEDYVYQNDAIYIQAAMRYGGSRTDQKHRGKGLPQMMHILDRIGHGHMTVFSRGGWCHRGPDGKIESGSLPYSIGGTLIEWEVRLPETGKVE